MKVAICGIDGAGKTVLIEKLLAHYQALGFSVAKAKVDFHCKEICQQAELLQETSLIRIGMAFDFLNYYRNFKSDCQLLLCDRFDACYRVLNRVDGLDGCLIEQLDKLYSIIEDADLYLYLDLPVSIAAERLALRGDRANNESDEILESMKCYYKSELKKKNNVVVIDASKSPEVIFETAKKLLDKLMR